MVTVIILAAGKSERLHPLTKDKPKCLLKIGSTTLIERNIKLLSELKVSRIVVVGGYGFDNLKKEIEKINEKIILLNNKRYEENNIVSLWFAREYFNDDIIIVNSDILIHKRIMEKIVNKQGNWLMVDKHDLDEEDMKIKIENGKVKNLSKQIRIEDSIGEYIGLARFEKSNAEKLSVILEKFIENENTNVYYEDAIAELAKKAEINILTTDGYPWTEIDTFEDFEKALYSILPQIEEKEIKKIEIPLFFIIDKGIIKKLRDYLKKENLKYKKIGIISDRNIIEKIKKENIGLHNEEFKLILISSNSLIEVEKIREQLKGIDLVIGLGGGKVIDCAKYASFKSNLKYISSPTTLSHDGICSPVCVLKKGNKTLSLGAEIPLGVLVDLEIIKECPKKFIINGIGDLVSTYTAIYDWGLANREKGENINQLAAFLSESAFSMIAGSELDLNSEEFLKTLAKALILRGIAMNISGNSRPASGSEHQFSHALDQLYNKNLPHGFQVGIGTIISSYLQGKDYIKIKEILKKVGAPTTLKEMGLKEEEVIEAILKAPTTRKGRYTILNKLKLDKERIRDILREVEL